jgi:transglutaminase/protease-like cytokinesis protein 3
VCEGYAKSFKYILDDLGIPCVIVCGVGQNSNGEIENHAWNYVKLKDKWYAVDCTWDDPIIIGSGYVSESVYTKNFLKGSREFFKDHTEDGKVVEGSQFVYPTLSEDDY